MREPTDGEAVDPPIHDNLVQTCYDDPMITNEHPTECPECDGDCEIEVPRRSLPDGDVQWVLVPCPTCKGASR